MESFALYLLKSVTWLTGFALVFFLFLRNERFFLLNRAFLVTGILTSFFFPFISIHYTIVLPVIRSIQIAGAISGGIQNGSGSGIPYAGLVLSALYMSGGFYVLMQIIRQSRSILMAIKKAEIISLHPVKLIRTTDYTSAFSFFSYVFVNPSVTDLETKEIMNHELVHIRQRHWFDLMLAELLCMLQWFNPVVWIYVRFIRQNHEYLADEVALQRTSDPAVYRATLLNQIAGSPVVNLTNSFNYSLNKKRFNMMKKIISSPYRKIKLLLILPVFAIVLYSFAKPDYKYIYTDKSSGNTYPVLTTQIKEVKGTVIAQGEGPLPGANITVRGTTVGTVTDENGRFKLVNLPDEAALVVSFVGYKTKVIKPVLDTEMTIKMVSDTIKTGKITTSPPPPPPPPPPSKVDGNIATPPPPPPPSLHSIFKMEGDGQPPVFVLDGTIITESELNKIDPQTIESITVLKAKSETDNPATDKYGEKGKNGVVEITSKKVVRSETGNDVLKYKVSGIGTGNEKTEMIPGEPRPLVLVDGVISDIDVNTIDVTTVESVSVLKDISATKKYGEKGKNGVIEITTKSNNPVSETKTPDTSINQSDRDQKGGKDPFVVVEEMPKFQGGKGGMSGWISDNLKYPAKAVQDKITGVVYVNFVVSVTGKVKNVAVNKSVHPLLDAEAVRVISSMPDWKPARQNGKSVPVSYNVPVEFKLK